jgi:hypothetical protein
VVRSEAREPRPRDAQEVVLEIIPTISFSEVVVGVERLRHLINGMTIVGEFNARRLSNGAHHISRSLDLATQLATPEKSELKSISLIHSATEKGKAASNSVLP